MSVRTRWSAPPAPRHGRMTPAARARRRFLKFFPGGFRDATYLDWERDYKWAVHERWDAGLSRAAFERLLAAGAYGEIAARALKAEQSARHSMVFSYEKMALRDAVRTPEGARTFALGLATLLHGEGTLERRFAAWIDAVAALPRPGTRVLTWPVVTVFGFVAQPARHVFVKPTVVREAARRYGFPLDYASRPSWTTYASVLAFARAVRRDVADLEPRDMIDVQSFIWVLGSSEYD